MGKAYKTGLPGENNLFDFAGGLSSIGSLAVTIGRKATPANPNQYTNNVYIAPDKSSKTESGNCNEKSSDNNAIYNRNWLSYQLMKAALLVWLILFKGNRIELREALKGNARVLNTKKNGYEAESHFLRLVVLIEFFLVAGAAFTAFTIVILAALLTGEEVISTYYIFYSFLIPLALMIVHTWKSVNLEIIKARKLPYRVKSGYFTEVRNSDLIPSIIIFAIVVISTVVYYWD